MINFSKIAKPKKAQKAILKAKRRGAFDIQSTGTRGQIRLTEMKKMEKLIKALNKRLK